MEKYFSSKVQEFKFEFFGTPHLVALGIILALFILLPFIQKNSRVQKWFCYSLAIILLVNDIEWHIMELYYGTWQLKYALPLNICALACYASIYTLITGSSLFHSFLYFAGIGLAFQALITPDVANYGFPHRKFFETFILHGGVVIAGLYITIVEKYRPSWSSLFRLFFILNIYMIFIGLVNYLLGSNFLLLAHKPASGSILDHFGPWPWYILVMEVMVFLVFAVMCLPFVIAKKIKR